MHAVLILALVPSIGRAEYVYHVPQSTKKICQLTGDTDQESQNPTDNQTETRAKLLGSDLGISFNGPFNSIFFLLGDSPETNSVSRKDAVDSVAYTTDHDPEDCIALTFIRQADGGYKPPTLFDGVKEIRLGRWEVPTGGFFWNGKMYVTFQVEAAELEGDSYRPHRSILASNANIVYDDLIFTRINDFDADRFLNVSSTLVDDSWYPSDIPTKVLHFGTGLYRRADNVYLAQTEVAHLDTGERLYFAGLDTNSKPKWTNQSTNAKGLFTPDNIKCMGELSVTWNVYLRKWLMLYSCDPGPSSNLRGINFRVADMPWGPWSEPAVLFHPRLDGGYCAFMYDLSPCPAGSPNPKDDLRKDGGNVFGGEYGAYLISSFTRGSIEKRETTIYFTMSTWNPYQVVLMKSNLAAK
jgi:hypothetical protein